MKKITLIALSIAALASCTKEMTSPVTPSEGQKVTLTFDVNTPATKVAFDDSDTPQFKWIGDETMTLVFGKYTSTGADNKNNPTIPSVPGEPGKFSGTVTIPSGFSISDLQAIVVTGTAGAWYDFRSYDEEKGTVSAYIAMPVPAEQVQTADNVPNFDYLPFFYDLSGVEKTESADNAYSFTDLTMSSVSEMLKFNVYGALEEGEVIKSVTLNTSADCHVGTAYWVLGRKADGQIENGGSRSSTVTLQQDVLLPTVSSGSKDGAKVYMSYMCKNSRTITDVIVATNKAIYRKAFSSLKLTRTYVQQFSVHQVALNLANGFTRYTYAPEYSVDGGESWTSVLPETFSTLAVKNQLSADDLSSIKEKMSTQSAPVDLDLSGTIYESTTFPATFAGTAEAKNTYLESIKFPANVTIIAASAFLHCSSMTSVDLNGIKTINGSAFRYCGLVTLEIPKSVTSYGQYIFRDNNALTSVYYNSANTSGENTRYEIFRAESSVTTPELKVTVGPGATQLTRACLRLNNKLTELVFESKIYLRPYVLVDCNYLKKIVFKYSDVSKISEAFTSGTMWDKNHNKPGSKLEYKEIVVPKGCKEAYETLAAIIKMRDEAGYTIVEAAE